MKKDEEAFYQEVYDLDENRSDAYVFQHLVDTVYEWYSFKNWPTPSPEQARDRVYDFLGSQNE